MNKDIHFLKLSSFGHHNAAIDQNGFLYTWGKKYLSNNISSVFDCLGHADEKDYANPTIVKELSKFKTITVGCGEYFTVVSCSK